MGVCKICGKESEFISSFLGLCRKCILENEGSLGIAKEAHEKSRKKFGLTLEPPKAEEGLKCLGCGNECRIPPGGKGFCGLVKNEKNKLVRLAGTPQKGLCEWYYDALPTNCVASWVCPGGTGTGFPKYAYKKGPEYGYYNLAVFYGACNFDCLFCQNWHFRENTVELKPTISAEELARKVDERVSCICFFGGNPDPQLAHAIKTSRLALKTKKGILRVCLETNGNANWNLLKEFAKISFKTGGCIKFDLKFPKGSSLNEALCGVSNEKSYENFEKLVKLHEKRRGVPFLIASTLLIPGYVSEEEIREISRFIASLDPSIPYSLLAFYPCFEMSDLPLTSRKLAESCLRVARKEGLENVKIGNVHLLV